MDIHQKLFNITNNKNYNYNQKTEKYDVQFMQQSINFLKYISPMTFVRMFIKVK